MNIQLIVCAWCKSVKNPDGTWNDYPTPAYTGDAEGISHGICPACLEQQKKEWARKSGRNKI